MSNDYKIASFYRFQELDCLPEIKGRLLTAMEEIGVFGTIIIAEEGFNGTISVEMSGLEVFLEVLATVFGTVPECKFSLHGEPGFKRRKVKIKKEIVTLRKDVSIELGTGTHVSNEEWNRLLADPDTVLIDTRNDYEYRVGTFRGAINPGISSFSELPEYIEKHFDPAKEPKIAMFCTGGIRCEKFAPYLVEKGFKNVFQLEGGILRYLEKTPVDESLWEGECFVFDERVTVDRDLNQGTAEDFSSAKSMDS